MEPKQRSAVNALVRLYQETGDKTTLNEIESLLRPFVTSRAKILSRFLSIPISEAYQEVWVTIMERVIPGYKWELGDFTARLWQRSVHLYNRMKTHKKKYECAIPLDEERLHLLDDYGEIRHVVGAGDKSQYQPAEPSIGMDDLNDAIERADIPSFVKRMVRMNVLLAGEKGIEARFEDIQEQKGYSAKTLNRMTNKHVLTKIREALSG